MRAILALIALMLAWTSVPALAADPAQLRFDAAAAQVRDHYMLADPQAAVAAAHRAEPLAQRISDPTARKAATATALWLQAEGLYRQDALEAAAPLIARAYALVRGAAPGSKLEADILLTRGTINGKQVRVAQALEDFQAAHRLFRANGDARREAISLICIANLYLDAKDYRAVLRYLGQALDAYHADAGLAQSIYNARGAVLKEQGKYEAADAEFRQAIGYARELKSSALEAVFLRNIAANELKEGKVAEAEASIVASRRLSTEGDDRARLDALAAQAALQKSQLAEATRLIGRVFAKLDLTTTDIRYHDAHLTAVAIYRATGRPDAALAHLLALKRLDDQITKLATETSNALMAARFDSANQEARIARLKLEDDLQQARAQRTMTLFGAGATAVVVVLLLIFIGTIRRSRDQVRAANDDLAVTNTALGKALAAKTEFLATTSHEIRTPLNGILGMTQVMLADTGLAGAMRDRLGVVHGAGLTMRALVDDILDVAKMETGNLAIEQAPFDLPACLTEASAMWREQARDKGLTFSLDLARCPARVKGDTARVRQIVFNLLSNAMKFTTAGSVSVVAEAAGEGIRIAVTDTGIGIAAEKQAEVFESFRQADTSTTRRFGGTGLGLSICRSLAQAMGGEITLASRPGAGSTFTVALPLPILAEMPSAAKAVADGTTVLVVDRNPITRAMFRSLLAPHAGTVAFAGTADEAVARLGEGDVAQVLVDDGTARAGGDPHGFVRTLVAAGSTPISLLWPVAAGAEAEELLASGLAQVIDKPISGAALVRALFGMQGGADLQPALVSQAA